MYQIREEHLTLLSLIEEADGELTPEIEQALQLTQEEFDSKAVSYANVVKGFSDTEDAISREIDRLTALKERAIKRAELFKSTLSSAMQQFGIEKIETPTIKLSFRKSEAIEITDENAVPESFQDQKVTTTISKTRIKEAIKQGTDVPGAQLISRKSLQIK